MWARGFTQRWVWCGSSKPLRLGYPKQSAAWFADVITSRQLGS